MDSYEIEEKSSSSETVQLVSFTVENEEYGVHISDVESVIRLPDITRLPQTPDFIKGVINLRGNVIPVIDMRERFGLETTEYLSTTRVMVMKIKNRLIGMIVDTVSQVIVLNNDDIEEAPEIVSGLSREYIEGIGKAANRMIIILKIDRVLTTEEIRKVKKAAERGVKLVESKKSENETGGRKKKKSDAEAAAKKTNQGNVK